MLITAQLISFVTEKDWWNSQKEDTWKQLLRGWMAQSSTGRDYD